MKDRPSQATSAGQAVIADCVWHLIRLWCGAMLVWLGMIPASTGQILFPTPSGAGLGDALEAVDLVWTSGGEAPWFSQTNLTHDGVDAAQSGTLIDYGQTWLETSVTGPGLIRFWWKVSTLRDWYFLSLRLDGELMTNYTGESDWRRHSFYVPPGEHILRWDYARYDEETGGQDAGWLDEVSFTTNPPVAPIIVGSPQSQVVTAGDDVTFGVVPDGTEPFQYQWRFNDADLLGEVGQFLRVTNAQLAEAGLYEVVVRNLAGQAISASARLTVDPSPVAWEWAHRGGGPGGDGASAVAVDPAGNVYVAGTFQGTATFDTNALRSSETGDLFLVKYDAQGHQLWILDLTDSGWPTVTGMKTDRAGNVFLGGYFVYSLTMGTNQLSAPGCARFIAKLDNAGQVLWVQTFGGTPRFLEYAGPDLAADSYGNLYTLASLESGTTFGGLTLTNAGGSDFFLAKLAPDGVVLWAQTFGTTNWDWARSVVVDSTGHVYFSGEFQGTLAVGTNMLTGRYYYGEPPRYGIFMAKCDPDGRVLWAQLGETNQFHGYDLAMDAADHLYARAAFYGTTILGGSVLTSLDEGGDYFLARLDPEGHVLWGRHIGNVGFGSARGYRLATDAGSRVYLQGLFDSTVIVDGKMLFAAGWSSSFLAAWDSAGRLLWTEKLPRYAADFASDDAGNIFLAGTFGSSIRLGTNSLVSEGGADAFAAKLAAVEPLRFAAPPAGLWVSNGQVHLQLRGCGGRGSLIVEVSSDLVNWKSILTNTAPTEPFDFSEPMDQNNPVRFYRARLERATPTLADALDTPDLVWRTDDTNPWIRQTETTHDGLDAAAVSLCEDLGWSWLETEVNGPGLIRFWWKISSMSWDDWVRFSVDDFMLAELTGVVDWQEQLFVVPPGRHRLQWSYQTGPDGASHWNAAWLDEVTFTPGVPTAPTITTQPVSQTRVVGQTATLSVAAQGIPSPRYQWQKDGQELYQQTNATLLVRHVRPQDAGRYRVLVSNLFGSVLSSAALLEVLTPPGQPGCAGSLDLTFDLGAAACGPFTNFTGSPGTDMITALVAQPDGKVIVAGGFTNIGGSPRTGIARVLAGGEIDPGFAPLLEVRGSDLKPDPLVRAAVLQPDGRLILGGHFTHANGAAVAPALVRFETDGTLDSGFTPATTIPYIYTLALDASGRLLVGGSLHEGSDDVGPRLMRLDAAGRLERDFDLPPELDTAVRSVLVQADGRILVNGLYRFLDEGLRDDSFRPPAFNFASISAVALQADGRILLGGAFRFWAPWYEDELIRLHPDGSLDWDFSAGFTVEECPDFLDSTGVAALAVQPDDRILVVGNFGLVDGLHRHFVARLFADGTPDNSFDPQFESCHVCDYGEYVSELALTPDGKLVVAGNLSTINGLPRQNVARLDLDQGGCLGVVALTTNAFYANESNGVVAVTVMRHGGFDGSLWIAYATFSQAEWYFPMQPAVPDTDYTPETGTLEFGAGESNKTVLIHIARDRLVEPVEEFAFQITGSEFGTAVGSPTRATIYLADEDSAGCPGSPASQFRPELAPGRWDIACIAAQPDGKFLVSGSLGLNEAPWAAFLARFNGNGSLDPNFSPRLDGYVNQVLVLPGGQQMLVCGSFAHVNDTLRNGLARLNADGSLDSAFDAQLDGPSMTALDVQASGQIVVCGWFRQVDGVARPGLARLNADGSLDPSFDPGPGPLFREYGYLNALAVQTDGKVLLGGYFHDVLGVSRNHVARLNADGSLDLNFTPNTNYSTAYNFVQTLLIQPDAKIVVGGALGEFSGAPCSGITRLNPDGSTDPGFVPSPGFSGAVDALARQADGKLLIGGDWGVGYPRIGFNVARLNPDGSLDPSLFVGTGTEGGYVSALALLPDGDVIIGGDFQRVNGHPAAQLARLHGDALSGPGAITFSAPWLEVDENVGQAAITLHRMWGSSGEVGVTFTTRPGTAVAGRDYSPLTATVQWADGDTAEKLVNVPVTNDTQGDWDRTVQLELSAPAGGASLGPYATAELKIRDDDTTVQFEQTEYRVSESAGSVQLHIQCRGRSRGWWLVDYATQDGTAVAGIDYASTAGTVRLPDTWHGRIISVPVCDNAVFDGSRSLYVALSNPSTNVTLGTAHLATVTIEDDDATQVHPGALDPGFTAQLSGPGMVTSLAEQADGNILVGGWFQGVNEALRWGLARLTPDGALDDSFRPQFTGGGVNVVLAQLDGKVVIGGQFEGVDGWSRPGLARLLSDGELDSSFDPGWQPGSRIDGAVLQPDGRLVVSGLWQIGWGSWWFMRLQANGPIDNSFLIGDGPWGNVAGIALQPDGKIVIGGDFDGMESILRNGLLRLHPNGTVDESFDPSPGTLEGIRCLALQPDGKVLVGGPFTSFAGQPRTGLARVHPDGGLDLAFASSVQDGAVEVIVLQPDGKVLIGGGFLFVNGVSRRGIARLNSDGSLDRTFDPGRGVEGGEARVETILLQDRYILIGGAFTRFNDVPRNGLAQLYGDHLVPPGPHPADLTPADWQLAIGEVTAYGAAWRRGQGWPAGPVPIPIDYVTRAAALWRGGECYTVDSSVTTEPLWWVNCASAKSDAKLQSRAGSADLQSAVPQVFNLPPNESNATARSADSKSAAQQTASLRYDGAATRQAPPSYVPGEPVSVAIAVLPGAGTLAYAVEEAAPAGWTITALSHGAEFDPVNRKVKWGPFFDNTPRTLSYTATPPLTTAGSVPFRGVGSFDGARAAVAGLEHMVPTCRLTLWAGEPGGTVRVSLTGVVGAVYVLEASSDLENWTPLATVTNTTGRLEFSDPTAVNYRHRFYRTVLP